jgi:hypothetical protein
MREKDFIPTFCSDYSSDTATSSLPSRGGFFSFIFEVSRSSSLQAPLQQQGKSPPQPKTALKAPRVRCVQRTSCPSPQEIALTTPSRLHHHHHSRRLLLFFSRPASLFFLLSSPPPPPPSLLSSFCSSSSHKLKHRIHCDRPVQPFVCHLIFDDGFRTTQDRLSPPDNTRRAGPASMSRAFQ